MIVFPEAAQAIAIDMAVVGASVLLLKQWLRSDIERVEASVTALSVRQDEIRDDHDMALKEVAAQANASVSKLADTVELFVREAAHERLRKTESDGLRDKNFEARLVGLEITTQTINKSVDRIAESVDVLLRRDAS
jgi:hypothetical protein